MVKKLLHTRYRVNDLDKTISFYKDVLGLEEVKRHKSPRMLLRSTRGAQTQAQSVYLGGVTRIRCSVIAQTTSLLQCIRPHSSHGHRE